MLGAYSIDHGTLPVNEMFDTERFYVDLFGGVVEDRYHFNTRSITERSNPPVSFIRVNQNAIGLFLQWVDLPSTADVQSGPRYAFEVAANELDAATEILRNHRVEVVGPIEQPETFPIARSVFFRDPDGNALELCTRRGMTNPGTSGSSTPGVIHSVRINHVCFECLDLARTEAFYTKAFALEPIAGSETAGERLLSCRSGQLVWIKRSASMAPRSANVRGPHVAFGVKRQDFSEIRRLVVEYGGRDQGDVVPGRKDEEADTYVFDPDGNRIQVQVTPDVEQGFIRCFRREAPAWQRFVA